MQDALKEICQNRIVIVGENAVNSHILQLQLNVAESLLNNAEPDEMIHIIFQRFHFEIEWLLEDYLLGRITFDHLVKTNNTIMSTQDQNVDVSIYKRLMEWALRNNNRVKMHSGVIPQPFARWIKQRGLKPVLS
jgi:uncharacterized iron-regulated protein